MISLGRAAAVWLSCAATISLTVAGSQPAAAWGDEGHRITALVARHFMTAATIARVDALLAADTDETTPPDMASASVWADKFRAQERTLGGLVRTAQWHFVDIEIDAPNLDAACFGHPGLPSGALASQGPAHDCVVDKIEQFQAELSGPTTPEAERILALKFLIHFIGDVHQPLHSSDHHDRGGNDVHVDNDDVRARNLHAAWDVDFVGHLGADPQYVADGLAAAITPDQAAAWSAGRPADWAMEAFALAQRDAYGLLGEPMPNGFYRLSEDYVVAADGDVALQLSRAGVRLATTLNAVFGSP